MVKGYCQKCKKIRKIDIDFGEPECTWCGGHNINIKKQKWKAYNNKKKDSNKYEYKPVISNKFNITHKVRIKKEKRIHRKKRPSKKR